MKTHLSLFIFIFIAVSNISYTQTYVSGDVYGVWEVTGSPFYVQGDITIPNDSTLGIEPGVSVIFEGYYALNVQGRLLAIGTENDTIIFTIIDTTGFYNPDTILGGWNGIQFIDTPVDNDTSKISFCKLQYGKAVGSSPPHNSGGAIHVSNFNKVIISNCLIRNNSAGGVDSPTGGALSLYLANIILENNEISYNRAWDGGGVQIWESNPIFNNNTIVFNTADQAGGGIWIGELSNVEFNGDVISYNSATGDGGGLICWQTSYTTFNLVNMIGNVAVNGGGINLINCEFQINGGSISDNAAGWIGGGINAYSSIVQISNTNFERDTAFIFGGAMGIYYSELTVTNSNLSDNGARILGGGIHSDGSNINLINTTFERDTTIDCGGAIFTWICDLVINDCEFNNNSSINGGAISSDSCSVLITNSDFTQNTAVWGGGVSNNRSDFLLENCSFTGNVSEHGGAIYTGFSNAEFANISFEQNYSIWGGGIEALNTTMHIDSCLFLQNEAAESGGGIQYHIDTSQFVSQYELEILNTSFSENSAFYRGAMELQQFYSETSLVDVKIDKCEFLGNAIDRGGNLLITGYINDFVISNSIFRGNTASLRTPTCQFSNHVTGEIYNCLFNSNYTSGGGAASSVGTGSNVSFMNCTFYDNIGGAALTLRNDSHSILVNNIFWENERSTIILNAVTDSTPCTLNIQYCDIQYGRDSIVVNDTISVIDWGEGNIIVDPLFADTLNNNFHLQNTSPCISAGIDSIEIVGMWYYCPSTDIEGNPRPNPEGSMPDIGAYESQYSVGVEDQTVGFPITYELFQNYPNPFNPVTLIKYSIPKESEVSLEILNILGQRVELLLKETKIAGTYDALWNASNMSSGIYFYRLQAGKFIQTKKMVLLR